MEFNKIAYCIAVPLLLICSWLYRDEKKSIAINLLAMINLLLIGNSFFVLKQLWSVYQVSKSYYSDIFWYTPRPQMSILSSIQLFSMIILPFFSVLGVIRKNRWFSLLVLVVVYSFYPYKTWNFYDAGMKTLFYLCLVCSVYALFWLYNLLPYQSRPR